MTGSHTKTDIKNRPAVQFEKGAAGSIEYLSRMISNLAAWPLLMLLFALVRKYTEPTRRY